MYQYENPPIKEILWQIRTISDEPWDWTIPGLFYSKIREKYPKKEQVYFVEMAMKVPKIKTKELVTPHTNQGIDKIIFKNLEETFWVQISPNIVTCNQLKPYKHWNDFKEKTLFVFEQYLKLKPIKTIDKIFLRYIDQIDIPKSSDFNFLDYFTYATRFPEDFPKFTVNKTFVRSTIRFDDSVGQVNLTLSSNPNESSENITSYIMDTEFFTLNLNKKELNDIDEWGEEAHKYIRLIFEKSLTDKTKQLFGEKIYD